MCGVFVIDDYARLKSLTAPRFSTSRKTSDARSPVMNEDSPFLGVAHFPIAPTARDSLSRCRAVIFWSAS